MVRLSTLASVCLLLLMPCGQGHAQPNGPWNAPLRIAWSTDGRVFSASTIFQDSSGVPSAVRWKGDTLVAVFQWFREPRTAPTWDRVAVKYSYDAGLTWTEPQPIVITGMPPNFQRPFDPTVAVVDGRLRIYFSSSDGMPQGGLNEIVNTYSAIGDDGLQYTFETGARYDHPTRPVIDPAVIYFRNMWHYASPVGAPQEGAHHAVSANGLDFETQAPYPSDNQHNWTGNFAVANDSTVRFYGSGPQLWYAESSDATSWRPFIGIGLIGGDPTVVKIADDRWMIIYVGPRYITDVNETVDEVPNEEPRQIRYVDVLGRWSDQPIRGLSFEVVITRHSSSGSTQGYRRLGP
jgi:hypothetical protein